MMLDHMVFALIQRYIEQGDFNKAAYNLYRIAKSNRMRKLTKQLESMLNRATQLKMFMSGVAATDIMAKRWAERLRHDLEMASGALRSKTDLIIEYPNTMKFKFAVDYSKMNGKESKEFMTAVSKMRELGMQVIVTQA